MQRLLRQALQDALQGDALSACEALRTMLDKREWDLVRSIRAEGASWADIARQVGVSRQALQGRVRRWEKDYGPADNSHGDNGMAESEGSNGFS